VIDARLGEAARAEAAATEAGARIFGLAEAAGVGLSHFEYHVALPDPWAPEARPDLGEVGGWSNGVLVETKFRHFRLDRPLGSFHPGQRGKWTAHELCHQLVGFAWWPGMSRLHVATMARLAEALPVALWYFFDDAGRARCPEHAGVDAFSEPFCRACERLAGAGPADDPHGAARIDAGRAFLCREIDGALRGLAEGRVIHTPWNSIDLASDGLAWSSAHGARLQGAAFAEWMEAFRGWGSGWRRSIDELVAGIDALAGHLAGGAPPVVPLCAPAERAAADLAWRFLVIRRALATRNRKGRDFLDRVLLRLKDGEPAANVAAAYAEAPRGLPSQEVACAVGYALGPGSTLGLGFEQVAQGIESALPATVASLRRRGQLAEAQARFFAADRAVRRPLARRFAESLPGGVVEAELASLEAALADPGPAPLATLALAPDVHDATPLRLGAGVEIVETEHDVVPMLQGFDAVPGPAAALVVRGADGLPRLVPLSAWAARHCERMWAGQVAPVPPDDGGERRVLVELGAWVAARST